MSRYGKINKALDEINTMFFFKLIPKIASPKVTSWGKAQKYLDRSLTMRFSRMPVADWVHDKQVHLCMHLSVEALCALLPVVLRKVEICFWKTTSEPFPPLLSSSEKPTSYLKTELCPTLSLPSVPFL